MTIMWFCFCAAPSSKDPSRRSLLWNLFFKDSWPYFKQLEYLAPFTKHRKTKGNFIVDIKPNEGHQLETINEVELLSSLHEGERICSILLLNFNAI